MCGGPDTSGAPIGTFRRIRSALTRGGGGSCDGIPENFVSPAPRRRATKAGNRCGKRFCGRSVANPPLRGSCGDSIGRKVPNRRRVRWLRI